MSRADLVDKVEEFFWESDVMSHGEPREAALAVVHLIEAELRAAIKADIDELEPVPGWNMAGRLGYLMGRDNAAYVALHGVPQTAGVPE